MVSCWTEKECQILKQTPKDGISDDILPWRLVGKKLAALSSRRMAVNVTGNVPRLKVPEMSFWTMEPMPHVVSKKSMKTPRFEETFLKPKY